MTPQISDIITIKIQEVFAYGVIGNYKSHRIYVDLIELSWETPISEELIPKVGDEIKTIVINISHRHDSDYLASVRHLTPEKNPWYDPSRYKIGDEFIGEIDSINSFGCWALHPNGADVLLLVDGIKTGLKKGQKLTLRITSINEKHRSIDAEIIQ
jgi:ribosomal protein S1